MSTMKQKKKGRRRRRTRTTSQIRELHPMRKRVRSKTTVQSSFTLGRKSCKPSNVDSISWLDRSPPPILISLVQSFALILKGGIRSSSYTHTHKIHEKRPPNVCFASFLPYYNLPCKKKTSGIQ